jgi:hypothetical protein
VLLDNRAVWQRRWQWTAFAGDSDWETLLTIMPLAALLLPALSVTILMPVVVRRSQLKSTGWLNGSELNNCWLYRPTFWLYAALGPLLLGWCLTRFQVAPLFHYRFLIASAVPLTLAMATMIFQLPNQGGRLLTLGLSLIWLTYTQGTLQTWRQGYLWSSDRNEGWQSASSFVSDRFRWSTDSLYCYAGLIEGKDLAAPLDSSMSEYLSYPLRGLFQVESDPDQDSHHRADPIGLTGRFQDWSHQIDLLYGRKAWIIFRGSADRLKLALVQAGLDRQLTGQPSVFGGVAVAQIEGR